ncbi:uncharacterized protein V1510DRAFT_379380 [Dipodascopsis tothii]|uniref:uncharacterized protein n=1 Tax=Dipodascopsis tothii TaxID=44089 RepID=UPI0034CFD07E
MPPVRPSVERLRRRTAHACEICRLRKTRCDGRNPCQTCVQNEEDCVYHEAPVLGKSKTDVVLETLLDLRAEISRLSTAVAVRNEADDTSSVGSARRAADRRDELPASIPNNHTSASEDLLRWHIFDDTPELREGFKNVYELENRRPAVPFRSTAVYPFIPADHRDRLVDAFQRNVNFWYPVLSLDTVVGLVGVLWEHTPAQTCRACLAQLVMAVGFACLDVERAHPDSYAGEASWGGATADPIGRTYFESANRLLFLALAENSVEAMLCLFYVGVYYGYLQRPIQAAFFLTATAAKCQTLLRYSKATLPAADAECLNRVFWACFILESDMVVELRKLPQSGSSAIESSVDLPSRYQTHRDERTSERSTLYFLACISIRRLLNRIHGLLYLDRAPDPDPDVSVMLELDRQLDEWHAVLPPQLKFSRTDWAERLTDPHQAFLRQRYLAAKSVIFRPAFNRVAECDARGYHFERDSPTVLAAVNCIDAALYHMLGLRGFCHTVFVDTWICALSMTGVALVLLVTVRSPSLKFYAEMAGPAQLATYLKTLEDTLESFTRASPDKSPTVGQCCATIAYVRQRVRDG